MKQSNSPVSVSILAERAYLTSVARGQWGPKRDGTDKRDIRKALSYIKDEVDEALEAYTDGEEGLAPSDCCPEHSSFVIQLADIILIAMDIAHGLGLDIEGAVVAKNRHNTPGR